MSWFKKKCDPAQDFSSAELQPRATYATISRMVRGWQRVVLMIVMAGVLVALASPSIPDPLSIPGRNVVVFAMVFLAMSFLHAFVLERPCFVALYEVEGRSAPDRLALICSRLC